LSINPKVLIIGATGFIGSHLLNHFSRKDIDTFGIARTKDTWRISALGVDTRIYENCEDPILFANSFQPTVIVNAATHGAYSFQDEANLIESSNQNLVRSILEWARGKEVLIIHLGSSSEYGLNSNAPAEDSLCIPNSTYAQAKLAATHLLSQEFNKFNTVSVALRLYSVFGPLEDPSRLFPSIVKKIINQDQIYLASELISRDYIFIDDVVNLIYLIASKAKDIEQFEVYNVCTGIKTTMQDLSDSIMNLFPNQKKPIHSFPSRTWDVSNWVGNPLKIQNAFGWKPKNNLQNGISQMVEFYSNDRNFRYLTEVYSKIKTNE
jgi:dolichol-phosphate mannosyltransferase